METPVCRVCTSTCLHPLPFEYNHDGSKLQAVECRDCGLIFLDPQPRPDDIVQMYSKNYFGGDFRCGHEGSYFDESTLDKLADTSLLDRIRAIKPAGRLLEIGCAGGAFLKAAHSAGFDVVGVELSLDAVEFARRKFNLTVYPGDLKDACFPDEAFDIVFMGDVLEHLRDPVVTLREVYRITARTGIVLIKCPTQTNTLFSRLGFAFYRVIGRSATVHLPPYHLFEYRPGSLTRLITSCGFEIKEVKPGIIPPGNIALRGSLAERIGKKLLHYPNYVITRILGVWGDRVEVIALRP